MAGSHQADFVQLGEFSLGINHVARHEFPGFNPPSNHILYALVSWLSVSINRRHEGSANFPRVSLFKVFG
jgi:hypothetical protein